MDASPPHTVPKMVGDPHVRLILSGTFFSSRSVRELSERYGIPLATCYRKVKALRAAGVLRLERTVLRQSGRPLGLYRAHLRGAELIWWHDRVLVSFTPWNSLDDESERLAWTLA